MTRRFWGNRKRVFLKASVDFLDAVCIIPGLDFCTFLVAKSNLAVGQTHDISVHLAQPHFAFKTAHGTIAITSLRNASESGETWMISGTVRWNSTEDVSLMNEYFANPRQVKNLKRKSLRLPVSIPATVDHWLGECTDVSKSGVGVALSTTQAEVGDKLELALILGSGNELTGLISVCNKRVRPDGKTVIGGTVRWDSPTGKEYKVLLPFETTEIDETKRRFGI
jgi:hypothetical protein